jgi:fluoroquinolone transport system ATP-binding protein
MLVIRGLEYQYPGAVRPALCGLDLRIRPGEILGIRGPAGSGKSALIHILAGRIRDYSGTIHFQDWDYLEWNRNVFERVGVSLSAPSLFQKLTARENLAAFAPLYRGEKESIPELLERAGLRHLADGSKAAKRPARGLTDPERKRLDLARALLHRPECLFADEPMAGLSTAEAEPIRNLLLEHRKSGRAALLTSEGGEALRGICDRWLTLQDGAVAEAAGVGGSAA